MLPLMKHNDTRMLPLMKRNGNRMLPLMKHVVYSVARTSSLHFLCLLFSISRKFRYKIVNQAVLLLTQQGNPLAILPGSVRALAKRVRTLVTRVRALVTRVRTHCNMCTLAIARTRVTSTRDCNTCTCNRCRAVGQVAAWRPCTANFSLHVHAYAC